MINKKESLYLNIDFFCFRHSREGGNPQITENMDSRFRGNDNISMNK
jgi:hypothetical protein